MVEEHVAVVPSSGTQVAGNWVLERPLAVVGGFEAWLARGLDGGRAMLFFVGEDAPPPILGEADARLWGTTRLVLRDPQHGRVVLDEIPEGMLLAERLALGLPPPRGLVEDLGNRLKEAKAEGRWHGQIVSDRIVLGGEGPVVAGWGLGEPEPGIDRDRASLHRLQMLATVGEAARRPEATEPPPAPPTPTEPTPTLSLDIEPEAISEDQLTTSPIPSEAAHSVAVTDEPLSPRPSEHLETGPTGPTGPMELTGSTGPMGPTGSTGPQSRSRAEVTGPSDVGLKAAILSSHLPTLRQNLEAYLAAGGAADDPIARKAQDALQRMEKKVATCLAEAKLRLQQGDSLGAVAPCREAIRLGAEGDAENLLRQARKQAKVQVGQASFNWRLWAMVGGGGLVLILLIVAAVMAFRPGPERADLERRLEAVVKADGERAGLQFLLRERNRSRDPGLVDDQVLALLPKLTEAERHKIGELRRAIISRGIRPQEADRVAEDALSQLASLQGAGIGLPAFQGRVQNIFLQLDRATSLYRNTGGLDSRETLTALDHLVSIDSKFGPDRPFWSVRRSGGEEDLARLAARVGEAVGDPDRLRGQMTWGGSEQQRRQQAQQLLVQLHRAVCSPLDQADPADADAAGRLLARRFGPISDSACSGGEGVAAVENLLGAAPGLLRLGAVANLRSAARQLASHNAAEAQRLLGLVHPSLKGTTWMLVAAWSARENGDPVRASRWVAQIDPEALDRLRMSGDEAVARFVTQAGAGTAP